MSKITRKVNRWVWTKLIESNGYHKLKIFHTPIGTFWILKWGYWSVGTFQFFSMGKFYIRIHKRFKL